MSVLNNTKKTAVSDWHRADIIAALKKQGWTLRALAKETQLSYSTIRTALDRPYPKVERLIADAIGVPAELIWAGRFAERNYRSTLTHNFKS
ncbi:DNA-binding protein [Pasteurellaceae bacterium HPA106]|uniref:helix-turn-helix domain-containing protein n=1 Tax=Spirabiliibacterium pneumoniae TaxID=221400 RepID=UPI001AACFDB4|nr:helix-turn-helix domain-containing protein [Spirabiliibacterium pneumoniae]MBE2895488.1 DNA-binding protein [Spirabiliibacterium pneumoniae]